MDEQFHDPACVACGLPEQRRRTAKEDHDVEVGRRGVKSGPGTAGEHRGQRVGEALSHDVPSSVECAHAEQRAVISS